MKRFVVSCLLLSLAACGDQPTAPDTVADLVLPRPVRLVSGFRVVGAVDYDLADGSGCVPASFGWNYTDDGIGWKVWNGTTLAPTPLAYSAPCALQAVFTGFRQRAEGPWLNSLRILPLDEWSAWGIYLTLYGHEQGQTTTVLPLPEGEWSEVTISPDPDIYEIEVGAWGYFLVDDATYGFPITDPVDRDECKEGGWELFAFRNQGQCVRFVETGKDTR